MINILLSLIVAGWLPIVSPDLPPLGGAPDGIIIDPNSGCRADDCYDELVDVLIEMIRRGGFGHMDDSLANKPR